MSKAKQLVRYGPSAYGAHFCLKPPLLLLLAIAYLSRALTLPIIVHVSSLAGGTADTTEYVRGVFSIGTAIASCIAVLVLYALIRRSPRASAPARWIWTHGRLLLAASAALDLVLTVTELARQGSSADTAVWNVLTSACDVYFLLYVLVSSRVRDTFADFPQPEAAADPAS